MKRICSPSEAAQEIGSPLCLGLIRSVVTVLYQLLLLPFPLACLLAFRVATILLIMDRRMRMKGFLARQA